MRLALSAWVLAVGLGIVSGAHAAEIVVPNANAAVEGDSDNFLPFIFTFEVRYQQVYTSSEFDPALHTITEIRLRPNFNAQFPPSVLFPNVVVVLSTTSAPVDGLSTAFADNLGTDATTVFQGPLTLSGDFSGPPGGPKDFDYVIPLSTPFPYDPTAGNLLLDILKSPSADGLSMDAVSPPGDPVSRLIAVGMTGAMTGTQDSTGLVTQFVATVVALSDAPLNDDFANAKKFPLPQFCDSVDMSGATTEPEDPTDCAAEPSDTVWYCHMATEDGLIEVDSGGSEPVITRAVYLEEMDGALTPVACNDDQGDLTTFQAVAGETYYFMIDAGEGEGRTLSFCVRQVPPPPNDDLADAKRIPDRHGLPSANDCAGAFCDDVDTRAATAEPDEPDPSCVANGGPHRTVWYEFTAGATRDYEALTCGSDYDTVLAVYQATAVPGFLAPVGCNDDGDGCGPQSQVFFTAEEGSTYFLQVGGKDGDPGGNLHFCLQLAEPSFPVCRSKRVPTRVAVAGETITYFFRLSNCSGPVDATNVIFTDVPPAGTTFVPGSLSISGTPQPMANPANGVDLGTIPAFDNTTFVSFQVLIDPGAPAGSEFRNSASWTYEFVPPSGGMSVMGSRTTNDVCSVIPFDPSVFTWFWVGPAAGLWSSAANWSQGSVPTGASRAHVDDDTDVDSTVTVTGDRAALEVLLDHKDKLIIAPASSLKVFGGLTTFADGSDIMLAGGTDGQYLRISHAATTPARPTRAT